MIILYGFLSVAGIVVGIMLLRMHLLRRDIRREAIKQWHLYCHDILQWKRWYDTRPPGTDVDYTQDDFQRRWNAQHEAAVSYIRAGGKERDVNFFFRYGFEWGK